MTEYWKKTYNAQGHESTVGFLCRHCKTTMLLRTSRLNIYKANTNDFGYITNGMMYKCPNCDWITMFEVPCDLEYFKKIFQLRGEDPLYLPSIEEFKEHAIAKQKLKDLGYL